MTDRYPSVVREKKILQKGSWELKSSHARFSQTLVVCSAVISLVDILTYLRLSLAWASLFSILYFCHSPSLDCCECTECIDIEMPSWYLKCSTCPFLRQNTPYRIVQQSEKRRNSPMISKSGNCLWFVFIFRLLRTNSNSPAQSRLGQSPIGLVHTSHHSLIYIYPFESPTAQQPLCIGIFSDDVCERAVYFPSTRVLTVESISWRRKLLHDHYRCRGSAQWMDLLIKGMSGSRLII